MRTFLEAPLAEYAQSNTPVSNGANLKREYPRGRRYGHLVWHPGYFRPASQHCTGCPRNVRTGIELHPEQRQIERGSRLRA